MSSSNVSALETSLEVLNILLDVAIAFVVIGLILEYSPKFWSRLARIPSDRFIEKTGEIMVILGVTGELGMHIWSAQLEDKIKSVQRDRIVSLEWQNKNLTAELLHVAMPRTLNVAKLQKKLAEQPKFSFEILFDDASPDAPELAFSIWKALKDLEWTPKQSSGPLPLPPSPMSPQWRPRAVAAGGKIWGVTVISNKGMEMPTNGATSFTVTLPAFKVAAALAESIGDQKEQANIGVNAFDVPDGNLRIIVGAKSPSFFPLFDGSP